MINVYSGLVGGRDYCGRFRTGYIGICVCEPPELVQIGNCTVYKYSNKNIRVGFLWLIFRLHLLSVF